jgi:hypothetical protein
MMKVFAYFNLHKKVWSLRGMDGLENGYVLAHASNVELADCTFKVSEAGRQRVIREGCKNVHAGIVGTLVGLTGKITEVGKARAQYLLYDDPHEVPDITQEYEPITYNPYVSGDFRMIRTDAPLASAESIILSGVPFGKGLQTIV